MFSNRHRCLSNENLRKRKGKKKRANMSVLRGVWWKCWKWIPLHIHIRARALTSIIPPPSPPSPRSRGCRSEKLNFSDEKVFSLPPFLSSPFSLSSHPFFNLVAYLWTINLCFEREINGCAVKCSGWCHAHNKIITEGLSRDKHTQTHATPRGSKPGAAYQ